MRKIKALREAIAQSKRVDSILVRYAEIEEEIEEAREIYKNLHKKTEDLLSDIEMKDDILRHRIEEVMRAAEKGVKSND